MDRSIANWLLSWLTKKSCHSIGMILSLIAHVIFPIVYCQCPESLPTSTAAMHAIVSSNGVLFGWQAYQKVPQSDNFHWSGHKTVCNDLNATELQALKRRTAF